MLKSHSVTLGLALLSMLLTMAAAAHTPLLTSNLTSQQMNVLLIVCDDLRPQMGAYNHSFMKTPNFDAFAKSGLLFERAYTNYAYCCPSRNS
jgi:hypothetical protein